MGTKNENREPTVGGNYKEREDQQQATGRTSEVNQRSAGMTPTQQQANFSFNPNIISGIASGPFNMNFNHRFEDPSKLGPDLKFDMNNLQGMNPQGFGQNQAGVQQTGNTQQTGDTQQAGNTQQTSNTQQTGDTQSGTQADKIRAGYAPLTGKAMDVNRFIQEANKMSQNSWFNSNAGTRWQNYINQQLSPSVQQELYQMIQQRLEQQASRGYVFTKNDMRYIEQALKNRHYGDGKVPENFDISGRMFDSTMSKVFNNMAASFYQQQKPAAQAPAAQAPAAPAVQTSTKPVAPKKTKEDIARENRLKLLKSLENDPAKLRKYQHGVAENVFGKPMTRQMMAKEIDRLQRECYITPQYAKELKQFVNSYGKKMEPHYSDFMRYSKGSEDASTAQPIMNNWNNQILRYLPGAHEYGYYAPNSNNQVFSKVTEENKKNYDNLLKGIPKVITTHWYDGQDIEDRRRYYHNNIDFNVKQGKITQQQGELLKHEVDKRIQKSE